MDLYQKMSSGLVDEELLIHTAINKAATDWSADGRFLLYRSPDPKTGFDLWALPMEGNRMPFPVVRTNFDDRDGQFSPDGRWIAYQSNESGRFEIYVQPFPGPGTMQPILTRGGAQVRWRRAGRELFYIALDGRLMSCRSDLLRMEGPSNPERLCHCSPPMWVSPCNSIDSNTWFPAMASDS